MNGFEESAEREPIDILVSETKLDDANLEEHRGSSRVVLGLPWLVVHAPSSSMARRSSAQ